MPRHCYISEIKLFANSCNARVFNAEFLVLTPGAKGGPVHRVNIAPIAAAHDAEMGNEGEPDESIPLSSMYSDIHRRKRVIVFPIDGDASGFDVPPGKGGLSLAAFSGRLGDAHEDDHTLL